MPRATTGPTTKIVVIVRDVASATPRIVSRAGEAPAKRSEGARVDGVTTTADIQALLWFTASGGPGARSMVASLAMSGREISSSHRARIDLTSASYPVSGRCRTAVSSGRALTGERRLAAFLSVSGPSGEQRGS